MRALYYLLFVAILSCSNKKNMENEIQNAFTESKKEKINEDRPAQKDEYSMGQTRNSMNSDDSVSVVNRAIEFLNWYKENYDKLSPNSLVNLNKDSKELSYTIDTIRIDEYKSKLEQSDFFSVVFLKKLTNALENRIQFYRQNIVIEVPDGFDHDFIFHTQEMEFILRSLNDLRVISVVKTNQQVSVNIWSYQYIELVFIDDMKWKIYEIR